MTPLFLRWVIEAGYNSESLWKWCDLHQLPEFIEKRQKQCNVIPCQHSKDLHFTGHSCAAKSSLWFISWCIFTSSFLSSSNLFLYLVALSEYRAQSLFLSSQEPLREEQFIPWQIFINNTAICSRKDSGFCCLLHLHIVILPLEPSNIASGEGFSRA